MAIRKITADILEIIRDLVTEGCTLFNVSMTGKELDKTFIFDLEHNLFRHTKGCDYLWIFEKERSQKIEIFFLGRVISKNVFIDNCKNMLKDFDRQIVNFSMVELDVFMNLDVVFEELFFEIINKNNMLYYSKGDLISIKEGLYLDSLIMNFSDNEHCISIKNFSIQEGIEKFFPTREKGDLAEIINFIKFDFCVSNVKHYKGCLFLKNDRSTNSWYVYTTIQNYLVKELKGRIKLLTNRFSVLLFGFSINLKYNEIKILEEGFYFFFPEFKIEEFHSSILEYRDMCYDLSASRNLLSNNDQFPTMNFIDINIPVEREKVSAGIYGGIPHIVVSNQIKIFFSGTADVQEITFYLLDKQPEIILEEFFFVKNIKNNIVLFSRKLEIKRSGIVIVKIEGKSKYDFDLNFYKWLIFIGLNNQKNVYI